MKKFIYISLLCFLQIAQAHIPATSQLYGKLYLHEGEIVNCQLDQEVSAETVEIGHPIRCRAYINILVNQKVVIAESAYAEAIVIKVEKAAKGKYSSITILLVGVNAVDGTRVALNSTEFTVKKSCKGENAIIPPLTLLSGRIKNSVWIKV